jgi:hypothetical protein
MPKGPTGWKVDLQLWGRQIVCHAPSGDRYKFEVFQGQLGPDFWRAFKAMEMPSLSRLLPATMRLFIPRQFGPYKNLAPNRNFFILKSGRSGDLVLRKLAGPEKVVEFEDQLRVTLGGKAKSSSGVGKGDESWQSSSAA